ncbi:hypothetical protein MKZ08_06675 [Viridibacillus sp. FSL R5-0477]|uniref:Uncharacterized protein n=1 Tax=Viridibacillus arenosi FSL R5-213 TaxID=1227360 RepID=W4ER04_9BACL|nr:hypothetical protein [Viridibacillus arenosi]ETT82256.1 hypothetical protein C176_14737 [Viridibacillus arenosi FSL R5-213]OMC92640.1 hypothetical protein BK137_06260 [Viridibacillus arenosi]
MSIRKPIKLEMSNKLRNYLSEQNILESNDYRCNFDTIKLKAKMSIEEKEVIYSYFENGYYTDNAYWQVLRLKQFGITIKLNPRNLTWHSTFNAAIEMSPKFFHLNDVPYSITQILTNIDWRCTEMHIAFDYRTNFFESVTIKHHGNQSHSEYSGETIYIGSHQSNQTKNKIASYDRNVKEAKRNNNITHKYMNRFETRLRFKMDEMRLNNINHNLICERLKKYLFVSNINAINGAWNRNRLLKVRKDYSYYEKLRKSNKKKDKEIAASIREVIKENREQLENIYKLHFERLLSFLQFENLDVLYSDFYVNNTEEAS